MSFLRHRHEREEEAASSQDGGEYQHTKRQKTLTLNGLRPDRHDDYTIAWICALHIEMAAACAMLDDIHDALPTHTNDDNTYTLGSIEKHGIVVACLPTAQYGTNNAANVVTNLKRSFPSIRLGLMVGIGGGVPTQADIRLGDIVVGTRVMQYDLGKAIGDGQIQPTAIPRILQQSLGTCVSALRAKHEFEPSRVPSILRGKLERLPDYCRPTSADRLFQSTYDHQSPMRDCDECDQSKLVARSKRVSDDPKIHYGAIASGNKLMRSAVARDDIGRQLDVLCFEMEAAGVVDILPCLVIRGICDYSDSHKAKNWQRYAAATAAAYAVEFLGILSAIQAIPRADRLPRYSYTSADPDSSIKHRQRMLDRLKFDQIDSWTENIQIAHHKTCGWFLKLPAYHAWQDPDRLPQHHGLLWISGKPGAGKSTLMKFAYSQMKNEDPHTACFFFHARGMQLERSVYGMYRSLLFQLLSAFPDLQTVFDDTDLVRKTQDSCPPLQVLKELFRRAVLALDQRTFTCFVDALDECDEQQALDMLHDFADLAHQSTDAGLLFRVCFASRHYPYAEIPGSVRFKLEDQSGHAEGMAKYIESRLSPTLIDELRPQILEKAAGVFLWVVLVVKILNKEDRRGGLALRKRFAELPSDLGNLFKDILARDKQDMESFKLCILWTLYVARPLTPKEYYHALWSGLYLVGQADPEPPDVTAPDASERIGKCVITSSKGLAEITDSKDPRVQFIHESVRDFLIKDDGLRELWPDLELDWVSRSHEILKQCCNTYMNHPSLRASVRKDHSEASFHGQVRSLGTYSLLKYAGQHVLYHANAAADAVPQDDFLSQLSVPDLVNVVNLLPKNKRWHYSTNISLFYLLAESGFAKLIRTRLKHDPNTHIPGGMYRYPLFVALARGKKDAVAALLNLPSTICDGVDITEEIMNRRNVAEYESRTELSWAAQNGGIGLVTALLRCGANTDKTDEGGQTPLSRASGNGHVAVARLLIQNGADVNSVDNIGWTPLFTASRYGYEVVVRLLIENGADVDFPNDFGWTPLFIASGCGHEVVVRLLIENGADMDITDNSGWTPLFTASSCGREVVVRLLIEKGADVTIANDNGWTPLLWASNMDDQAMVGLLIERGANVNASDEHGRTPLFWASIKDHQATVGLLIERGANVNASDDHGQTPLFWASTKDNQAMVGLLIERGANVNASDEHGRTPLFWASTKDNQAMVGLLIERGADTPLWIVEKYSAAVQSKEWEEVIRRI